MKHRLQGDKRHLQAMVGIPALLRACMWCLGTFRRLMTPYTNHYSCADCVGYERAPFSKSELSGIPFFVHSSEVAGANAQNPLSPHDAHENRQA